MEKTYLAHPVKHEQEFEYAGKKYKLCKVGDMTQSDHAYAWELFKNGKIKVHSMARFRLRFEKNVYCLYGMKKC
jgi:hypothetical protein